MPTWGKIRDKVAVRTAPSRLKNFALNSPEMITMLRFCYSLYSDNFDIRFVFFESREQWIRQHQEILSSAKISSNISISPSSKNIQAAKRSHSLMYRKGWESLIEPFIHRRIQYTSSRRETIVTRPPEDTSRRNGGRSKSEHLGFASK